MKRMPWMVVLIAAVTVAGTAHAGGRSNSLEAGRSALLFSISGSNFFSLSTFDGGVGVKHQTSDRSAWRFVADLGGSADKGEQSSYNQDHKNLQLIATVLYQRYVNPDAEANLYWGVGPTGGYSRDTRTTSNGPMSSEQKDTEWQAGIQAVVGMEWFATQSISLHAEYAGYATYAARTSTRTTSPQGSTNKFHSHDWSLLTGRVLFGMSIYF